MNGPRWLMFVAPLLLAVAGTPSQEAPALPPPPVADEGWPAPYAFIHAGGLPNNEVAAVLAALPFERIELQRTACFGDCPDYKVTLHRDGSARYEGRRSAARKGSFTGRISPFDYGRLCFLLESQGFEKLERKYSAPWTCSATSYLRIWRDASSEPISVEDYGQYGPLSLWSMMAAVDGVASEIDWTSGR